MDSLRRVRWSRVLLVLLALLVIIGGITTLVYIAGSGTRQASYRASSTASVLPTATRSGQSQALQIASQPTSTVAPTSTRTSTQSSQWQMIFSDDFNGTALGPGWGTYTGPHGGGKSYYSPSEVSVGNGVLKLGMEKKTTSGLPYTTGGIGAFRYVQTYGNTNSGSSCLMARELALTPFFGRRTAIPARNWTFSSRHQPIKVLFTLPITVVRAALARSYARTAVSPPAFIP